MTGTKLLSRVPYILIPLLAWFFYSGLLISNYHSLRLTSPESRQWNYFSPFANSLLHGRLDIDCPPSSNCHDLVEYNGKYYLYWPPAPVLLYLPIVAVLGTPTPDLLISATLGAFNVLLLMLFVRALVRRFKFGRETFAVIYTGLFWAFGTVHFYMAMNGTVWFISQIMAQTFLLCSLLIFIGSQTPGRLLLSGILFGLACYTRNHLVFSAFTFAAIYFTSNKLNLKINLKHAVYFLMPFIFFSGLNMVYNYVRFDDVLENGLLYHRMGGHFHANFFQHGYFSSHYIPENFMREVIHKPESVPQFPYFKHDEEGFGLLWASPVFLLLIPALIIYFRKLIKQREYVSLPDKEQVILMSGMLLSAVTIALIIFSIMGTGYVQFASRYSLDYQLMLILFLLVALHQWSSKKAFRVLLLLLLIVSFYMNYAGVRMFYEMRF